MNQINLLMEYLSQVPIIRECTLLPNIQNKDDSECVVTLENNDVFSVCIKTLQNGYPAVIEEKSKQWCSQDNRYIVFAIPFISEKSMEICKRYDIGCIDLAGNCYFKYHSIFLSVTGNKNKNVSTRGLKSIYERSSIVSSKILRIMFQDITKHWKLKDLAMSAGCSIGQVSKVKDFLIQNNQMQQTNSGIILTRPEEVLNDWARVYNEKKNETIECYSLDSIAEIEYKLSQMKKNIGIDSYLSGYSGGVRYIPSVRYHKVHTYVASMDIERVVDYLDCKETNEGSNISIILPYDECVFIECQQKNEEQVVSPVQIYLDCMALQGRGEELAESILEKEILK